MGTLNGWIAIGCLAVGTFLIRYSFLGLFGSRALPPSAVRLVQLAVPAIFAALVLPLIAIPAPGLPWTTRLPHVFAALVTGLVAWRRGGMMLPIVAGFATLYAIRFLAGTG